MKKHRAVTVRRMKEILAELPDEYLLEPNLLGNILVLVETDEGDTAAIGFIDVVDGKFEAW